MSQPQWKLVAQLGDVHPIDYGGCFVYVDETGVYDPEMEILDSPEDDACKWTIYRFDLPRCTWIDGILSDNKFHPDHAAWFAKPESERASRPQDSTYLADVAQCCGQPEEDLQAMLCSEDPKERALAYLQIGQYHGFENFDSYPLTMNRAEVEARYAQKGGAK